MIRNLLVLLVFLGVGLGASVAQSDIFVRQSPKEETREGEAPKKRSIFLRPMDALKNKNPAAQNRYRPRLNTDGVRRRVVQDMRHLAFWQQNKRKPQSLRELQSYAIALRANNLKQVLEQRNAIIPKLDAQYRAQMDRFNKRKEAQAPDLEAALAVDAVQYAEMMGMQAPASASQAVYQNFGARDASAVNFNAAEQEEQPRIRTRSVSAPRVFVRPQRDEDGPGSRVVTDY